MRQKQQVQKVKEAKANRALVKLGPREHSSLFTGSPNLAAKKVNLGTKNTAGKVNKSGHPAFGSPKVKGKSAKKSISKESPLSKSEASGLRGTKRFRPGTKALREIRKFQKGTNLLVQRAPFQRLVREVTSDLTDETTRFTADALECLQTASEAFVIQVFEDSVLAMIHAKRVTLMVRDIQFIRRLRGI